jgi:hypothetical protein
MSFVGQGEAAGGRSMWGYALKPSSTAAPACCTSRAKPAVVKGAPRSEVNTNRDFGSYFGSYSRCSRPGHAARRHAADGRRVIPSWPRGRQGGALSKSIWSQRRSTNSDARTRVSVGDQDHRCISMSPPVALGRLGEAGDLGIGQVFPRPHLGVGAARRHRNCSVFGGRSDRKIRTVFNHPRHEKARLAGESAAGPSHRNVRTCKPL